MAGGEHAVAIGLKPVVLRVKVPDGQHDDGRGIRAVPPFVEASTRKSRANLGA